MLTRDEILRALKGSKSIFFQKYPLKSMGLFGSFARNEGTAKSDVDVLVEFNQPVGFEIVDLALDLEQLLGYRVDVVSKKGLKATLLPYVEKDLIYV
jgi:predicted nucleotidyltransferase